MTDSACVHVYVSSSFPSFQCTHTHAQKELMDLYKREHKRLDTENEKDKKPEESTKKAEEPKKAKEKKEVEAKEKKKTAEKVKSPAPPDAKK